MSLLPEVQQGLLSAPPRLIAEIVSPGNTNRDGDYLPKRAQYAAFTQCLYERIAVPEYWLIEHPIVQIVTVLTIEGDAYREVGVFGNNDAIRAPRG